MAIYLIYKNDNRSGSKKKIAQLSGPNAKAVIAKGIKAGAIKAGSKYLVIPHSIQSKYMHYVTKEEAAKARKK